MSADPNSTVPTGGGTSETSSTGTAQPQVHKKNIFDKMSAALNKVDAKAQEWTKKANEEVNKAVLQINEEAARVSESMKRDMASFKSGTKEALSDTKQQINEQKKQEFPEDMGNLIANAILSLDAQLRIITQQIKNIKQKQPKLVSDQLQALDQAKALIFVSEVSGALGVKYAYGRGVVIRKLEDGSWSQPCAVETIEIGAGFQFGISRTQYVIPLFTESQVDALTSDKDQQLSLTGSVQFAFGNDGRLIKGMVSGSDSSIKKDNTKDKVATNSTIADSQGIDIGVGIGIRAIQNLNTLNKKYYYNTPQQELTMSRILNGAVTAPIISDDDNKMSDLDKVLIQNGQEQYVLLISMLSEGMITPNDDDNDNDNVDISAVVPPQAGDNGGDVVSGDGNAGGTN